MNTPENLNDTMTEFAADAIADARLNHGVKLDGSDESMQLVEKILAKICSNNARGLVQRMMRRGLPPKELDKLAKNVRHLGELVRTRCGGEWEYDEKTAPGYRMISLKFPYGVSIFPPLRVHRRLTKGEEHNVWLYFQTLMRDFPKRS